MNAEITSRVLYLDKKSDKDILLGWATALNHPIQKFLDKVFCVYTSELFSSSKKHFLALQEVVPELKGMEIKYRGKKGNRGGANVPKGMKIAIWKWYEIENYLVYPSALARFISLKFGSEISIKLVNTMNRILPPFFLDDQFTEIIDYNKAGGGKSRILEILKFGNINLQESQFHQIAEVMREEEIHQDVKEMLIGKQLGPSQSLVEPRGVEPLTS